MTKIAPPSESVQTAAERLRTVSPDLQSKIAASAPEASIASRFLALFQTAPAETLWRLQPYTLAREWGTNQHETLESFLLGCHKGIFELHWLHHCPGCNATSPGCSVLGEIPTGAHCGGCKLDFVNTLDENIEVIFSASRQFVDYPSDIEEAFTARMMGELMSQGRFDTQSLPVTGHDCINTPLFRDLFGDQVLPLDQSLQIRSLPIMFTDIRGSTEMYQKLGDVRAYKAVRNHFNILFAKIREHNGVVVKTIGDAVMATFNRNQDALEAGLSALKEFPYSDPSSEAHVEVKIGIHAGPCIAVNLNGVIDYFGSTVNIAARVQGTAKGGELVVTREILTCPHCAQVVKDHAKSGGKEDVVLKGIAEPVRLYRLRA